MLKESEFDNIKRWTSYYL